MKAKEPPQETNDARWDRFSRSSRALVCVCVCVCVCVESIETSTSLTLVFVTLVLWPRFGIFISAYLLGFWAGGGGLGGVRWGGVGREIRNLVVVVVVVVVSSAGSSSFASHAVAFRRRRFFFLNVFFFNFISSFFPAFRQRYLL